MWVAGRNCGRRQPSHTHSSQKHLQEYYSQTTIPASRYAVAIQQKAHLGSHRETGTDRISAHELDGSFGSECFNLVKTGQLKWFFDFHHFHLAVLGFSACSISASCITIFLSQGWNRCVFILIWSPYELFISYYYFCLSYLLVNSVSLYILYNLTLECTFSNILNSVF